MGVIADSTNSPVRRGKKPVGEAGRFSLKPLKPRMALVEQVVSRMREGIFEGEFPVGSELPSEGNLAKMIGVSYTVIREAMRTLRAQGLIQVSQGCRARVKPAGPEAVSETLDAMLRRSNTSLHDLTELRRPLECEMVALAAQRATPSILAALEQAIHDQENGKTIESQIAADIRFHDLLAEAAGNMLFGLVLSTIWGLLWESRERTISRVGAGHAVAGHQTILDAIKRRDIAGAREAMAMHIDRIDEDLDIAAP